MRAIKDPRAPDFTPEELVKPLASIRGTTSSIAHHLLTQHGLWFHERTTIKGIIVEIWRSLDMRKVGYLSSEIKGERAIFHVMLLPSNGLSLPPEPERKRAIRPH